MHCHGFRKKEEKQSDVNNKINSIRSIRIDNLAGNTCKRVGNQIYTHSRGDDLLL